MPKTVDRELRREQVIEATWRLMARVGIDRVSIRDIAAEAGYSTGVIGHYFRDKDEILLSALRQVWLRERSRVASLSAGLRGMSALRAVVDAVLPLNEEQALEMAVWVSFWGRAFGDTALTDEQRRYYGEWRRLLRRHFEEAAVDGELRAGVVPEDEAWRLAALVDGLGIQAVFEPARLGSHRLGSLVATHLESLEGPP